MSVRYILKSEAVECPKCKCSVYRVNGRWENAEKSRDKDRAGVRVVWGSLHHCPNGQKY